MSPLVVLDPETNRGRQFADFSAKTLHHVEKYSVPQYGDAPDDMVESWGADHVINQMEKYLKRMKNNWRGDDDNLLSCLKLAHYACILREKLEKRGIQKDDRP